MPKPDNNREFKDRVYELFAGAGKALANGHRLELLDLLCQAERGVEDLAERAGMSVANTSQHLQVLRRAGLVDVRRDGVRAFYSARDDAVALWGALRRFGEKQLPEIERIVDDYLGDRSELEAIGADELRARLERGDVVLLDVRPREEFEAGHIPGARSLPIDELEARIEELPGDVEIVAYCRGRYCVYSDDAVRELRGRGFAARRFEMGVADWQGLERVVH